MCIQFVMLSLLILTKIKRLINEKPLLSDEQDKLRLLFGR